jgi:hypothetical protein
MKKPTIEEWAQDCKALGIQTRRYGFANNQLSDDLIREEYNKTVAAIQAFANKYGMDYNSAESIAGIVSDSVALGLAY